MINALTPMGKKILVIEDDVDIVNMLAIYLHGHGYNISRASWGSEGLRLAEVEKPDLIILDIMLPDMNGWEVLEEIKKRRIPTRIIILTQIEGAANIIKFIHAGACDYINKPFDIENLRMRIEHALEMENTLNINLMNALPLEIEKLISELDSRKENERKGSRNVLKTIEYQTLLREKEQLRKKLKSEERKFNELNARLSEFERKSRIQNFGFRIFYIILSSLITLLFFQTKLITDSRLLFLLPIIIFFLLLFPVERIRTISAKHSISEAQINLDNDIKKKND